MSCDLVIVGVGGQGVLTIAELLMEAALAGGLPASLVPTKGMAQRGGFVKAELRLGAEGIGPRIADGGADLVIAMERSEGLKGVRFARRDGTFLLYDHVWTPLDVMLGRAAYPERAVVETAVHAMGGRCVVLEPGDRPAVGDRRVAANIFVLGAASGIDAVAERIDPDLIEARIGERWRTAQDANLLAFRAGRAAVGVR